IVFFGIVIATVAMSFPGSQTSTWRSGFFPHHHGAGEGGASRMVQMIPIANETTTRAVIQIPVGRDMRDLLGGRQRAYLPYGSTARRVSSKEVGPGPVLPHGPRHASRHAPK